jgi:hypothetical protein
MTSRSAFLILSIGAAAGLLVAIAGGANAGNGTDTTAPTVTCSLSVTSLWPPNHRLVNVGLQATVMDDQDPNPMVHVHVFGDEDDEESTGDGRHSPDAKNIDLGTLRLRAERKGNADGRVYLIVVTATDAAGNTGFDCCTVVVPRDRSARSRAAVNAQAAAAEATCLQTGAPPSGFFVIGDGPTIGPRQ